MHRLLSLNIDVNTAHKMVSYADNADAIPRTDAIQIEEVKTHTRIELYKKKRQFTEMMAYTENMAYTARMPYTEMSYTEKMMM